MGVLAWRGLAAAALGCALLAGCADGPGAAALMDAGEESCAGRLGCVTDHNIAAMVDRPSDLARPRKDRPRDALRREAVLSAWRGTPHAPRAPKPAQGGAQ
jgi:type IV pilus biogenesis protein CpaD/CtpE